MRWVRLERGNDWGHEYFSLPGEAKDHAGTCDKRRSLTFRDGSRLRVKWPSGEITEETVTNKAFRSTVSDMGRPYSVDYSLAGFVSSWRGIKKWIALDEVEIGR